MNKLKQSRTMVDGASESNEKIERLAKAKEGRGHRRTSTNVETAGQSLSPFKHSLLRVYSNISFGVCVFQRAKTEETNKMMRRKKEKKKIALATVVARRILRPNFSTIHYRPSFPFTPLITRSSARSFCQRSLRLFSFRVRLPSYAQDSILRVFFVHTHRSLHSSCFSSEIFETRLPVSL